jgi:CHASE3 domain sensor protein
MIRRVRESLLKYLQRGTFRRRLAYSLAIVRLILVPVIFLAIYYLFVMGRIVDRIVNEDAPAATLAQQASIEMLMARRAERTFLLSHDPTAVHTVDQSLSDVEKIIKQIQALQPQEQGEVRLAQSAAGVYANEFRTFVSTVGGSNISGANQFQSVIQDYEKGLDDLIRREKYINKTRMIDELRARVSSFDDQIMKTIQATDPALSKVTMDLQASSKKVLKSLSAIEDQSWKAVQEDHREARQLLHRAEWTLSIVSGLTFLLSIWISFILPKQLVQPLVNLKQAVDRAISDDHEAIQNISVEGELGQLAGSIRRLIARLYTGHPTHKV